MQGRLADAVRAAEVIESEVRTEAMPSMVDAFAPVPAFVHLRFGQWDELLKWKAPDSKLLASTALWHFSRAIALAAKGDRGAAVNIPSHSPHGLGLAQQQGARCSSGRCSGVGRPASGQ